ncbi:MAG: glycosyltransferase family 2 protein [Deltaproteobacteria bacterium]|nr:glycosyltransferase family 2 protein [Deltaproteobacteria bacterium]
MKIDVIIPVLNEERALPGVLCAIPRDLVRRVIVVDNGSTDCSAEVARERGATVVSEPRRGYGRAVWSGVETLLADPPDAVVFLDGDGADDPAEMGLVLAPILEGRADLVIGSRMRKPLPQGAMTQAQHLGNIIVPFLLRLLYGSRTTDLGPFRAVRWDALLDLHLTDRGFGITVEMQVKAARQGLRVEEVAVSYRPRIGESKISGTFRGAVMASLKILWVVARHAGPRRRTR